MAFYFLIEREIPLVQSVFLDAVEQNVAMYSEWKH